MKSAVRNHVTIFKPVMPIYHHGKMCSKGTACTVWHWVEDEFVYPGMCQAFRLDFILWFLQGYV